MTDTTIDVDFDYEGFARRLRDAIAPEKPTNFGARVGVSQPVLSKYLAGKGTGPRLDIVARIAEGAGCTVDWLAFGRGEGPRDLSGIVRIPRYDATLSIGSGSWVEGRRQLDDFPLSSRFLRERLGHAPTAGLFVLHNRGDSMSPTIRDGEPVLIDGEDTRINDGVYAFVLDGDARVKRLRKTIGGVTLISDNAAYPPEIVSGEALGKLQVIGRALMAVHLL